MREKKKPKQREREREFLTEGGSGCSILPLELTATHTISQSVNEPTVSLSGYRREEGRKHHMTVVVDDDRKTFHTPQQIIAEFGSWQIHIPNNLIFHAFSQLIHFQEETMV